MNCHEFVTKIANSASMYPNETFSLRGRVNTCVNPYSYHIVRTYPEVYRNIDGLYVDGMTMCWLIKFLYGKQIPRLSFDMSGMAADLFARLNDINNQETIYFIGAKQEEIERSILQIQSSYPNLKLKGYRNGYFIDVDDRRKAISEIVKANADFTIVGMGSPLQEQFALDLKNAGYQGTVFTCGGFLHQTSNRINYYPKWVNKYNLRAFYRLLHEKGMFKRLYNVLIEFPVLFTIDTLKYRLGNYTQ